MKLKTKLVLMSVAISSVMCFTITYTALSSAQQLVAATQVTPTMVAQLAVELTPIEAIPDDSANALASTPAIAFYESEMTKITTSAQRTYDVKQIGVMISIVALGAGLTWLFASQMLKPLERLTAEAKRINPNNLNEAPNVPVTTDEVGRLGVAFCEMTNKISDAYTMQKNFSASAAHELRTPLSVLTSEISVFDMQPNHTNGEYKEILSSVHQTANRLNTIVEDLLVFTNQGDVDLSQQIELKPLIEEIVYALEPISAAKNIQISITGENTVINGNDNLLQRAFYNLIENAIKYNNQNGTIEIMISAHSVLIKDTGFGIPDHEKPHIFEPFYRVDKSRSRAYGGSGLGLSIVKQILDKHSFIINVLNNTPTGTIFEVAIK